MKTVRLCVCCGKTEKGKHRHLCFCYSIFVFLVHKHNSNPGIAVESTEKHIYSQQLFDVPSNGFLKTCTQ